MEMESPQGHDLGLRPGSDSITEPPTERTIGQLVAQASQDMGDLFRAEVALAKLEIKQDVARGAFGGAMFGVAGYLALLASILLTIALAYGIAAIGLAPGWAFLITAVLFLLSAGIVAYIGFRRIRKIGPPSRAMRSMSATMSAMKPGSAPQPR